MERKNFIKKFAIGGSILLTAPVLFSGCSKDETLGEGGNNDKNGIVVDLSLPAYSALGTVGGSVNKGEIIIIRTSDTNYIALSNVCTHSGCTVGYNSGTTELVCPCHGSKFSTSGSVINGPAPTSLKKYNVAKEGNTLTIT